MTEGEFLKRFDEHLAFCRELLVRNDAFVVEQHRLNEEYRAERRKADAERRQAEAERRKADAEYRRAQAEYRKQQAEQRRTDAEHRKAHAEQQAEQGKAHAEQHQAMQDVRFELRQMSLRGERVAQGFIDVLRDLHEESVAGRKALFAMLDELKGGGPSAAGA